MNIIHTLTRFLSFFDIEAIDKKKEYQFLAESKDLVDLERRQRLLEKNGRIY
jgi:hypothetical protein